MQPLCRQFPCLEAPLPPPCAQSTRPARPELMFPSLPGSSPVRFHRLLQQSASQVLGEGAPQKLFAARPWGGQASWGMLGIPTEILLLPCLL